MEVGPHLWLVKVTQVRVFSCTKSVHERYCEKATILPTTLVLHINVPQLETGALTFHNCSNLTGKCAGVDRWHAVIKIADFWRRKNIRGTNPVTLADVRNLNKVCVAWQPLKISCEDLGGLEAILVWELLPQQCHSSLNKLVIQPFSAAQDLLIMLR